MSKPKIKAILLDKDGVLLDFQKTYGFATRKIITRLSGGDGDVLQALARDVGFGLCDNSIHPLSPLVAGYAEDICGVWAKVLNIANDREFQKSIDLLFKRFTEKDAVLINGVGAVLGALKPHYKIGIATNDTEACARAQLDHKDMLQYLDFLKGYDSGHGAKPGTGMALAFFELMEIEPRNVVMVGDSIHDMKFARDAGMIAIGISTGPLPGEELAPHADFSIDSLGELPGLLQQISD
jgi:phosphoglycolate phosphatase